MIKLVILSFVIAIVLWNTKKTLIRIAMVKMRYSISSHLHKFGEHQRVFFKEKEMTGIQLFNDIHPGLKSRAFTKLDKLIVSMGFTHLIILVFNKKARDRSASLIVFFEMKKETPARIMSAISKIVEEIKNAKHIIQKEQ